MGSRCCRQGQVCVLHCARDFFADVAGVGTNAKEGCQRHCRACSMHFLHLDAAARRDVHARAIDRTQAMRCQARQTHKPSAPDLRRLRQLRIAEFAGVGGAAREAAKRLLRRVQGAGAAVGVRGVAVHLVQGEEVAAEGAAQAHGRAA